MEVGTPALLFGSISLLLLAYTNRFFVLAKLVRELHQSRERVGKKVVNAQIPILRKRLQLIKKMQVSGVGSFILCTGSLFSLFLENQRMGKIFFTISILSLLLSLSYCLWEVLISTRALDLVLDSTRMEDEPDESRRR